MASGPLGRLAGLRSLPSSATRVLATAVGFVVLVAALFAGVGAWQDRDLTAAPRPVEPAPEPAPAPAPTPAPDQGDDPDADPDDDDADADDATPGDDADDADDAAPAPPATGPRPQDVTIQLLNGSGVAGATDPFRSRLDEANFRIVATNNARPRDETTIYYTLGFEAAGRLVASVVGTDNVFSMADLPDGRRLTSSVMVHVIVGAEDR